jgi:NDP-sugar pyrophosphorylase family protein
MSIINILIPMAGKGERMKSETPKPLIDVAGKSMIQVVIENFKMNDSKIFNPIFCVGYDHCKKYKLDKTLLSFCKNAKIVYIEEQTDGPACTALLAEKYINNNAPLIIINSDQIVLDFNIEYFRAFAKNADADGVLGIFLSNNPKNSYVRLNSAFKIIETKEKEVISNFATNGIHFWKRGSDFVNSASQMIKDNIRTNNEFYIAPSYNYLIKENKKILPFFYNLHFPIGTKNDLDFFVKNGIIDNRV